MLIVKTNLFLLIQPISLDVLRSSPTAILINYSIWALFTKFTVLSFTRLATELAKVNFLFRTFKGLFSSDWESLKLFDSTDSSIFLCYFPISISSVINSIETWVLVPATNAIHIFTFLFENNFSWFPPSKCFMPFAFTPIWDELTI